MGVARSAPQGPTTTRFMVLRDKASTKSVPNQHSRYPGDISSMREMGKCLIAELTAYRDEPMEREVPVAVLYN